MRLSEILILLDAQAPLAWAEPWDKVGLQLGDPDDPIDRALLCIDFTEGVLAEARAWGARLVVAYHPPIFAPLTELTPRTPRGRMLLACARERIALFAPHTALDVAVGGTNDHLADALGPGARRPLQAPVGAPAGVGAGRWIDLDVPVQPEVLAARVRDGLGVDAVDLAVPDGGATIRSVGVCVGAGGSLFDGLDPVPDALVTGELRHHDVLAWVARGRTVVLAGHCRTERPFLAAWVGRLAAATGAAVAWRVSQADKPPTQRI